MSGDRDSILDLCEACHDYPCSCDILDCADEMPPEEAYCPHCGKLFDDFSDMGCGHCDRRSPEWGLIP